MPHNRMSPIGDYKPLHLTATAANPTAVGAQVNTTSATTIVAGTNVVVTPASMNNIQPGLILNFANGTGAAEDVRVKTVNPGAGTFTADFVNGHSGAYTIISRRGTYLGPIAVGAVGTGVTITLYNGHPSLLPDAGQVIAVITPAAPGHTFACYCDKGLFYTLAGTPGDYSLHYADSV